MKIVRINGSAGEACSSGHCSNMKTNKSRTRKLKNVNPKIKIVVSFVFILVVQVSFS